MSSSSSSLTSRRVNALHRRSQTTEIRCRCGDVARMWTSWTFANPGRKFVSCPNYRDANSNCNFFRWIDPEVEHDCYRRLLQEQHTDLTCAALEKEDLLEELKKANQIVGQMKKIIAVLTLVIIIMMLVL